MKTIDMQTMRYMNLLDTVAHVHASKCFVYNNTVYFAVSPKLFSRALGIENRNVSLISQRLEKRVRIIRDVEEDISGISKFIGAIISPVSFASIELKDNLLVLTAGSRERAATLIGRNKVRLIELNAVLESYFGKTIRII
ncbi:hypothetical protein EXS72_02225 [Candidatus Pacearchaeota archaeon]|nr:hypothetical protein [Candidatus Pacearchaeota archaeon]